MDLKPIEVKVTVDGYNDVAHTDNPALAAQILSLILADQRQNPKSAEEILIDQAKAEAEAARSEKQSAVWKAQSLEKKLAALTEKVQNLTGETS